MNRATRRAAQAQARQRSVDRIVAVHEAGHAIGRLLTARDMGYAPEQAVHSIEINAGPAFWSADGKTRLQSQAICYGPAISLELQAAYKQAYPVHGPISPDELHARLANIGTARQRMASARAKMLIVALGPAAEARLSGSSWETVFSSEACLGDRMDFRRAARLHGLYDDQLSQVTHEVGSTAVALVAKAEIWNAIKAVAAAIKGNLSGKAIAQIAAPFITTSPDFGPVADFQRIA